MSNVGSWKSNVRRVGASLDRCRDQIDKLETINSDKFKKEIFSNANTK